MSLSQFLPSFDDVRGVLGGLSDEELDDAAIDLKVFEIRLLNALGDIGDTVADDYLAVDQGSMTTTESKFVDAVQVFSVYQVAADRSSSLELLAPRLISDGKATVQRQSLADFDELRADIDRELSKAKANLVTLVGGATVVTAATNNGMLVRSSPTIDPVTGE